MKTRTLAQKLSILALAAFTVPFWNENTALADPLPATFFSQNWNTVGPTDYPTVPFGGMRLWDTGTTWKDLEPTTRGHFYWAPLTNWLAQATNHDVLYTFGKVPEWAGGTSANNQVPSDFNSGNNAWKQFVTNLVQQSLASPTAHIKYYELWNEPSLQTYWLGSEGQMATMAQDASSIIRSLDPNALIVGPSPNSASSYWWITNYWAGGGSNCQDIVGYHLYLYGSDNQPPGDPETVPHDVDTLRSLMTQYGVGNLPIWYTEGSWGDQNSPNVKAMTSDDRVAYLARDYLFLWSKGVARFYWYSWDNPSFGTLWSPGTGVNSAGIAYGQLYNWLVGSTPDSTNALVKASDGTRTCSLSLSNGYQAQIVWTTNTQKAITLGANFTYYQTLDGPSQHAITNNSVTIGEKPILIVAPQGKNLALNQPVTVSSSSGTSYAGTNAVDGILTTRWSSGYSDNQWIYVDLGAVTPITGVNLYWQDAYGSSYKIQVSNDASSWTDVYSTTTGAGGTERIPFSASARYVKMLGIRRATSYGYSLWEFQVLGTVPQPVNLALNQPVTVSSSSGTSYVGPNAVDGSLTTRWSSLYTDNQWIYVDLGGQTPITGVSLAWENAYASSFKIQVSIDASTWTDVYSTTNGIGGTETIPFAATARYVKMLGIKRATSYGYSLWEFQVFGNGYLPQSGTVYQLVCGKSAMALDNAGSSSNGTRVNQSTEQNGDSSQMWQLSSVGGGYYSLICQRSGKALDNGGSTTAGTTNIQSTVISGSSSQFWKFVSAPGGYFSVICQKSNMSMDNGGSTTAGTPVTQWYTQSGNSNQYWQLHYR